MSTSHALLRCCCSILWMFVQGSVALEHCGGRPLRLWGAMLSFEVTHGGPYVASRSGFLDIRWSITESTDDQSLDVFVLSATSCSKHVVSGRFCLFIFACFQTTIIFLEVLGVASALVRITQVVSRSSSILHPAGLVGRKKNTLLGVVLTPFQCACACRVSHVLCQHHFRRPPLCFCAVVYNFDMFSLMGLALVARQRHQKNDCSLTFFLFLIGVVLAPILVTLVVSRRYSMLRVWSEGKTHCFDNPRTQAIQRCTPPPFLHLALSRHKKTHNFVDFRKHSVFLAPGKERTYYFRRFLEKPPVYHGLRVLKHAKESTTPIVLTILNVSIHVTVIIFSTPCSLPRYDVRYHCITGDCEISCVQELHVMSERTSPGCDGPTPKNVRMNLTLRVPPAITSRTWKWRELNMMKLPSCVMALTVPEVTAVLVFVRQTMREQFLPSDDFCCAVQILDAVGIWTKTQDPKASCGQNRRGLCECEVEELCDAQAFEGGLGHPPPFCVNWQNMSPSS